MLRPKAVCFLGVTNAAPAATAVFQHRIGETPEHLEIRGEPDGGLWRLGRCDCSARTRDKPRKQS